MEHVINGKKHAVKQVIENGCMEFSCGCGFKHTTDWSASLFGDMHALENVIVEMYHRRYVKKHL